MIEQQLASEPPLPVLLSGEELRKVQLVPTAARPPHTSGAPSSMRELQRLAGVDNLRHVGDLGPVLASLSMAGQVVPPKGYEHHHRPEQHRYEAVFGRDSLRAAMDLIEPYPKLARSTLMTMAQNQGVETNNKREEEPGRIPHEIRDPRTDPVARQLSRDNGWGWPYYGSVDATPEFIRTLATYCRTAPEGQDFLQQTYQGRDGQEHRMVDAFTAALGWIENRLGANPEGLLEYCRTNPGGLINQAWKDSPDAYFHANGQLANHDKGIASVEVQRVAYDALLDAADLYHTQLDQADKAAELVEQAKKLRRTILNTFWTDQQGGFFGLGTDRGTDGQLRLMEVKTSNMGHLLRSHLLEGDDGEVVAKREAIIKHLLSPKMLGLNGIRTLASDEARYRPGAYHNGSVWIWDNYLISRGLSQHGYHSLAHELNDRLLDDINSTGRFPEYLRGDNYPDYRLNRRIIDVYDRQNKFLNHLEQPPQDIQAWSVASILSLKLRRARGQHTTTDPHKRELEQQLLAGLN